MPPARTPAKLPVKLAEIYPASNYTCVAFDPGGTTGWAVFTIYPDAMKDPEYKILHNVVSWNCGQFTGSENQQLDEMLDLCAAWDEADIVSEDFILRQYRKDRELLTPVRLNAGLEYGLWLAADRKAELVRPIYLQQPSLAKSTMTDPRLKEAGYLEPTAGTPHARDAVRHALTFLRRRKAANAQGRDVIRQGNH